MFNSATALITALTFKHKIQKEDIERVLLSDSGNDSEYMYINKHTNEPIGYGSFTYLGMFPGRGKVWRYNGVFA